MARKRNSRSKRNADGEHPETPQAAAEEKQPKTTPTVTEEEQPKTATGLPASVKSSADASGRPSEQEGGTSKETESVTAAPRDARAAASQEEKTSLSCAGAPRAGSPAVRAAPATSPQTDLLSPRGEPPSTRLSDSLLLSPTTEKAEGAHSSGVRTPTKPITRTPEERVGDDLLVGRYSDVLGHHLPQSSFEATLPWTRTEYTCGLCAPSSTFILPTSTPIKADLTRYEGPDCKLITIRTRRYLAHQASFVDQVNIAQDRRSLWEMGKAVFSKEGFKFADARGVWNLVREVKRGCLEPGYYPVVEVRHCGRKVREQRVPLVVHLYH
ncbi:UNVERIFIED_CONTAM: hypothetical protein HHA_231880 [Hammondia hammondi]|eukprot:XP_008885673.1 hypothetical protein HHA_231880 [Hammondia hammondi]